MDFLNCNPVGGVNPAFLTHVLILEALQFHFLARSLGVTMPTTHSWMICLICVGVTLSVVRRGSGG